jgi:protein ImuB
MKVPSYDDLTPSISDVHPRDTFDGAGRLVADPEEPVVRAVDHRAEHGGLFACVRATAARPGALMALARDFSPRIERIDDTCVMLDVGGLGRLLGDAHGIAAELARTAEERGLKCRISVASTHIAAQLLTLAGGDAVAVENVNVAAALAPLPLRALEQITQRDGRVLKLFDILHRWGLRSIGEFAALPPDEISARFGLDGVGFHRLARGIDPRPLVPDPGVPRFIQSMELEWPIEELEPLSFVLARLLDPLSAALEKADKGAAAIRLDLRLVDKATHSRMLQLPASMRDPRVLRTLLQLDLESHPPHAGIDVVTIEVDPAPGRIVQFSLLERATPSPETLATLNARLGALVGDDRRGSPVLLDSHRPDALTLAPFNPDARPHTPAEPTELNLILRRFRPPVAIRVALERGRPSHIPIDRKGMPGGTVRQSAGPWRTSGAWWMDGGGHWDRDEWDVSLADGSVCRIYRERESGNWFMEAVVD